MNKTVKKFPATIVFEDCLMQPFYEVCAKTDLGIGPGAE
jgi:hypothetical protein